MKKEITGGFSSMWIIYGIIGYFVYGSISGALATILYSFAFGLLTLIGFVPFVGPVFYYIIGSTYLEPLIFELTGIYSTLLTSFIFWFNCLISIICTIIGIIACYVFFKPQKRRNKKRRN